MIEEMLAATETDDSFPVAPPRRRQKKYDISDATSEADDQFGINGLAVCQSEDEDYDGEDFMESLSITPSPPTTRAGQPSFSLSKHKGSPKSGSTSSHRSSCSSQNSDGTGDLINNTDNKPDTPVDKSKGKHGTLKKSFSGLFGKKSKKDNDKNSVKTKDSNKKGARLSIDLKSSNIVGKMVKMFNMDTGTVQSPESDGNDKSVEHLAENVESDEEVFDDFTDDLEQEEEGYITNTTESVKKSKSSDQETITSDSNSAIKDECDTSNTSAVPGELSSVEDTSGSKDSSTDKDKEKPAKVITVDIKTREARYANLYWSQMTQVQENGLLDKVSASDRKLQEAMFEIVKSEESHLISLNNFIRVYLTSDEFGPSEKPVLSTMDHKVVFSNITAIRDTSEKFLEELETRWQHSGMLMDICEIIKDFATNHFNSYIAYCSNQAFQDKKLEELKKNPTFIEAVKRLQSHEACQRLPLVSFLVLPMQRITRLPLLVSAIIKYIDPAKQPRQYESARNTLCILNNVVEKCNERAKKMQQAEEIFQLSKQIVFKDVPPLTIISSSRYLVKKGSLGWIPQGKSVNLTFTKRMKKTLYLFLFNDLLLLTRKDGDRFFVTDYAERAMLHVETFDDEEDKKTSSGAARTKFLPPGIPNYCVYPLFLVILENCKQKKVEYLFDFNTENARSDRERWLNAIRPATTTDTSETIYEDWDCPQVLCLQRYEAKEADELTLEESDVVRVFRKLEDGMYEGERLRDGQRGWFPQDCTVEVNDSHARARNLRMQYTLGTSTFTTNL